MLLVLCILIAILEGRKGLNDFKFGTLTGRFPRDDTASMAVKGLRKRPLDCVESYSGEEEGRGGQEEE